MYLLYRGRSKSKSPMLFVGKRSDMTSRLLSNASKHRRRHRDMAKAFPPPNGQLNILADLSDVSR